MLTKLLATKWPTSPVVTPKVGATLELAEKQSSLLAKMQQENSNLKEQLAQQKRKGSEKGSEKSSARGQARANW